jgi:hypothetical protein
MMMKMTMMTMMMMMMVMMTMMVYLQQLPPEPLALGPRHVVENVRVNMPGGCCKGVTGVS